MKEQQAAHVPSNETSAGMTRKQEELRGMTDSDKQQLHDLTRLRIERNRAARHARCATMNR